MKKKLYKGVVLLLLAALLSGCNSGEQDQPIDTENVTETENETQTEHATEEDVPVVHTVTITATGDCALGSLQYHSYDSSFDGYYDRYGEGYFFENFQSVFEEDDLTLINLECVFTDAVDRVEKEFSIKGKPEYNGILTTGSVEAVTLGNNHSADYGPESLEDTKKSMEEAGIAYAINDTIAYYTTEDGIVIAVVSASVTGSGNARDQYLLDGVAKARSQGADLVIACPHWGIEREHYPNDYQRNLGHALIEQGADLVIGNHAHVLQSVEEYKGKIIMYSLGNFSFGANRNPAEKDTAVYQQTFTFVDGVLQSDITARIIPTRLSGHDDYNDFRPVVANADQASEIIRKLNEYSEPYSGVFFDEQGNLLLEAAK